MGLKRVLSDMCDRESTGLSLPTDAHSLAAETFVARVRSRFEAEIVRLDVFGSTARGEARGLASDVDVLVVVEDSADHERVGETLREIAYDVMLEYGPVVELHVLPEREFERLRAQRDPFVRNVIADAEGQSYG